MRPRGLLGGEIWMELSPAEAKVMRAIAAREARRAAAERRAAQEQSRADRKPAPSRTGWSTKPAPGAAAKARPVPDRGREQWRQRHPDQAAEERTLRKGRAEMLDRWRHKNEGTPETHDHASRVNQGALARLWQAGEIDNEQLLAATMIQAAHEAIGADVTVRTASLETRVDVTRLGERHFHERLGEVWREMTYTRWRAAVGAPIAAVLAMIVGEGQGPVGFSVVARRRRMRPDRAKRLLIDALDAWAQIFGEVRREVDEASVAAAWAGLI